MKNLSILKNGFITNKILDTVLWVNTLFRGQVVFCGSFGLVARGLLHRPIHDVDCITDVNYYGTFYHEIGQYGIGTSNLEKFQVDGIWVLCFKLTAPNGVIVDVMYREDGVESDTTWISRDDHQRGRSGEIRVEKPASAIRIKKNYLKLTGRDPNPESIAKHKADLAYIAKQAKKKKIILDVSDDLYNPDPNEDISF